MGMCAYKYGQYPLLNISLQKPRTNASVFGVVDGESGVTRIALGAMVNRTICACLCDAVLASAHVPCRIVSRTQVAMNSIS